MSVESAKKFLQEKAGDNEITEKVKAASSPQEAIVTIAAEEGYDFTYPELVDALKPAGDEELDLEELNSVAGGELWDFCGALLSLGGLV